MPEVSNFDEGMCAFGETSTPFLPPCSDGSAAIADGAISVPLHTGMASCVRQGPLALAALTTSAEGGGLVMAEEGDALGQVATWATTLHLQAVGQLLGDLGVAGDRWVLMIRIWLSLH